MTFRFRLALAFVLLSSAVAGAQEQATYDSIRLGTALCTLKAGSGSPEAVVTGIVCDTYLQSNTGDLWTKQSGSGNTGWGILPRLNALNIFTVQQEISAADPLLYMNETDQGSNLKLWRLVVTGGVFKIETLTDAFSIVAAPVQIARAGGVTLSSTLNVTGTTTLGVLAAGATTVTTLGASGLSTLAAATVTTLGASGNVVLDANTGTTNFVAQTTGWRVTAAGAADMRYLYTDEMRVKLFTADLESVLAGSQRITKSFSTISQAFTCPAAAGTATLWVKDAPTFGDAAVFVSGDSVIIHSMTRTVFGPFTVTDCVGAVTSYADGTAGNAGQQSWTFTRGSGGNAGTMTASTVVAVNELVQDMGTTGNGYLESTAVDGAASVNAPYMQIVTWATAPVAANLTTRCRVGNLKGLTTVTEYGLFCGNFSGNAFVRLSDVNAEIRGIPLKLYDGATETMRLDASVPSFALGSTLPSAYGTGTGCWMGKDTVYKFRCGDPAGNRVAFDGTDLIVVSAGLTIDSTGIGLAPATGGAYASTRAFRFISPTSEIGMSASVNGSVYNLYIYDKWATTGSVKDANIDIRASSGPSSGLVASGVTIRQNSSGGVSSVALIGATISLDNSTAATAVHVWGDLSLEAGKLLQQQLSFVYPGGVSGGGMADYQTTYYLATHSTRGIVANTGSSWDGPIVQATGAVMYPGTVSGLSTYQTSYYLASTNQNGGGLFTNGSIDATGSYTGRAGSGGAASNVFNIYWTAGQAHLYIDATDQGTINITSDRRIKKNIQVLPVGLREILLLHPKVFEWRNKGATPGPQYGLIAQDVDHVLPAITTHGTLKTDLAPDGLWRIDYQSLIPVLVKAVQEQQAQIAELRAQLAAIKKPGR